MKAIALLIGIFVLAASNPAEAQGAKVSCAVFKIEQTRGVPQDIAAFFARIQSAEFRQFQPSMDGSAVRRCENPAGNKTTEFLSPVEKHFGVCHFAYSDVSDLFSANGTFQTEKLPLRLGLLIAPTERMLASESTCPRQDEPYISVSDVSPDVFRLLVGAYTQLHASPAAFDTAVSEVPPNTRTRQYVDAYKKAMQGLQAPFSRFVKSRFGKAEGIRFIGYTPANNGSLVTGRYVVSSDSGWEFEFEFAEKGVRLIGLSLSMP